MAIPTNTVIYNLFNNRFLCMSTVSAEALCDYFSSAAYFLFTDAAVHVVLLVIDCKWHT